ncbi:hypothetical protein FQR65_LT10804 [Abscondita terminalis]|nr:hypothetical protein FQR65_LT10804 [Abscondita terminalis]
MLIFLLFSPLLFNVVIIKGDRLEFPELAYLNTTVDPCDDFYEYSCGNYKNARPRPQEYPLLDNFVVLQDELHRLLNSKRKCWKNSNEIFVVILSSRVKKDDPVAVQKARTAYSACLDTLYADYLVYPEVEVLTKEGPWPLIARTGLNAKFSWSQMGDIVADYGLQFFVRTDVTENPMNVSEYLILVDRDSVLNPSVVDQYEDNVVDFLNHKTINKKTHPFENFLKTVAMVLRDATGSDSSTLNIAKDVGSIFEFMKLVQKGGTNTGGFENVGGFFTVESLQGWIDEHFPRLGLNLLEYCERVFSKSGARVEPNTNVLVASMSWLYGILDLIANVDDDTLLNYIFARLFTYTAPDSNREIREAYERFRRDMGDIVYNRTEYCTRSILGYPNAIALSMAVTYEYQRYHFNLAKLERVATMINDLRSAFNEILNASDWLDATSLANSKTKADKMIALLGYPDLAEYDELLDRYYSNVRICASDHFGNAQRTRAFSAALNLALLDKARNKRRWNHSPLVVNAFYNSQNNRIVLPVSMLNPVFYNGRHNAMDYARLGAVIGHEITHGFDNLGSQYDGDGNMAMGWSAETREEFRKREQCFREQYGGYFIKEIGKYINPNNTMRENLADNGGLREAFLAFKRLPSSESFFGYSSDQLFFISYATMWCAQETPQYLEKLSTRGYSPAKFRVIGSVSNNEDFAKAFSCPVGSNMNPARKCVLW